MIGPDKNKIHPNPDLHGVCFIKNVVKNPNIVIGDYTYYDDYETNGEDFEKHVTHFYPFIGDKLIIGKFCAIAKGVKFIMNGANHRMDGITTYPFNIMGNGWEKKSIPPYSIAVGNPCKTIKKRFDDKTIERLLELKWWDWDEKKIFDNLEALVSGKTDALK